LMLVAWLYVQNPWPIAGMTPRCVMWCALSTINATRRMLRAGIRRLRDIDVDIARTVEGIKEQRVITVRIDNRNSQGSIHFLRGHRRQFSAPFVALGQHLVGDDV